LGLVKPLLFADLAEFADLGNRQKGEQFQHVVPVERIELPTFGLQNRCSTAELNRRIEAIGEG
jgi:hypothetical protein